MELKNVIIYRITHVENIPHILQNGITHKNSAIRNLNFKNIGDMDLIGKRSEKKVHVDNGVFESEEYKIIVLGDFIPF